jgi:hypothetical protein
MPGQRRGNKLVVFISVRPTVNDCRLFTSTFVRNFTIANKLQCTFSFRGHVG